MRKLRLCPALLLSLMLPAGQAILPPAVLAAQDGKPAATPEAEATPPSAVCAVCGVREKAGPEPVAATFVYQGKTYYFCKQACKEEFRLDPEKWIRAAAAPPAETPSKDASAVPT
jgi:YHS domain-containing protein